MAAMVQMPGQVDPYDPNQQKTGGYPTPPMMPQPSQNALKSGWEYAAGADPNDPNALVRNTSTGQMLTVSHPGYLNYSAPGGAAGGGGTPNTGGAEPMNPYAPPASNTTNAGGQQMYRDALIQQMSQKEVPDMTNPALRAQVDPYRAAIDRQVRGQIRSDAESSFAGGQSYGEPERLAAAERGGQQAGMLESQLVTREIQNNRDEIQSALRMFGATLSDDQRRALEEKLAMLDAQLKREGMAQTGSLAGQDIGLRRELGYGGLNNQLLSILFGNDQFNKNLGRLFGLDEANLNRDALLSIWG